MSDRGPEAVSAEAVAILALPHASIPLAQMIAKAVALGDYGQCTCALANATDSVAPGGCAPCMFLRATTALYIMGGKVRLLLHVPAKVSFP